ncbi:MAG: hypothetical protein Q9227_001119 [Pyrenula ochraceoflavens]
MAPQEILIIGCSIAGPTLATFLLLSSPTTTPPSSLPHITILEQSATLRTNGQNIDVRGSGISILRKLGIESAVRRSTTGEEGVKWVDAQDRVWAESRAGEGGARSPTSEIEILRGRLGGICYRRSKEVSEEVERKGGRGVEYVFGDCAEEIEQEGEKVWVKFKRSGVRRSFDLVVGADGLQSSTRKMVWGGGREGEEARVKRLGMYGGFFSMPRGGGDSDWRRWFHAPGRRGIMMRPHEEKERSTAFMYVINEEDRRLREAALEGPKGAETQKKLLAEYFQDAGWECERIIREMMATKDFYYDMVGQVKMDKWSKGRVVLLGDAGYCASPISGMGTTLALNGAYHLAGALTHHPNDYTAAFAAYEEKMRPIVDRAQKLAPGMPYLLNPETAWGLWILHMIIGFIAWSGVVNLVAKVIGPPANTATVEEYGFRQLPEMSD